MSRYVPLMNKAFAALEHLLVATQTGQRDKVRENIRAATDAGVPDSLIEQILEATRPPTLPLAVSQRIDFRIARAFSLFHLRVRRKSVAPLSVAAIDVLGVDYRGDLAAAIKQLVGVSVDGDALTRLERDTSEVGHAYLDEGGMRIFSLNDDDDQRVLLLPDKAKDTDEDLVDSIACQLMRLHDLIRQALETGHEGERVSLLEQLDATAQALMYKVQRRDDGSSSEPPPAGGVDATPILRSVVMEASARAKARGIGVRAIIDDDLRVFARTRDLRAIASNLIENALDASERGGPVRVTAVRDGDHLDLRVQDDGEGLDEPAQQRAFATGFTTRKGGGGLGLPLVKHLVTRVKGTLVVESEVGVGTTMCVLLPRYEQK
ncbi:MAG: signal transduction histidine kinase [Polyangiales bacterium]